MTSLQEAHIGGYFINEEIRDRLRERPDMRLIRESKTYSLVVGTRREKGDPLASAFITIEEPGRPSVERQGGGSTLYDALSAAYRYVRDLVKSELEKNESLADPQLAKLKGMLDKRF